MTTFSILPEDQEQSETDKMTYKGVMSVLKIQNVVKADEAIYKCSMSNPYGADFVQIKLVVRGKVTIKVSKYPLLNITAERRAVSLNLTVHVI